jgi:hypothetical protein
MVSLALPPADHLLIERDRGQFVPFRRRRMMNANLGALAKDKVWLSCTIILPLRAQGDAGSPVRPVAIGAPSQ